MKFKSWLSAAQYSVKKRGPLFYFLEKESYTACGISMFGYAVFLFLSKWERRFSRGAMKMLSWKICGIIKIKSVLNTHRGGMDMEKQKFNLHTHTARCGHGDGLDVQYVRSAIDAGFELLGFSEHIPYVEMRLPGCRMFYEQKEEYISSIRKLKAEYSGQIDIKVGYEVEFLEDHFSYLMQMKQECDYMILGQHCKYIGYEYDCYCSDEDVLKYAEQIEKAAEKDFITYIAHPDYYMLGRRVFSEACVEASHRIAEASSRYHIPLEINLNGFRYGKKPYQFYNKPGVYEERYPYPFREFWEIASSYGCQVLYGYDAHSPITLLEKNREYMAEEIIKGIPLHFAQTVLLK